MQDGAVLHLNDLVLQRVYLHLVLLDDPVVLQLTLLQAQRAEGVVYHVAHGRRKLHRARHHFRHSSLVLARAPLAVAARRDASLRVDRSVVVVLNI